MKRTIRILDFIWVNFIWLMVIIVAVAGCPFVPLVWMLIHASPAIIVWLGVDLVLTGILLHSLIADAFRKV